MIQEKLKEDSDKDACLAFIFSLTSAGAFDESFINALSKEHQQMFIEFVASKLIFDDVLFIVDLPDDHVALMRKLYAGCVHLIYKVNTDSDKGVAFLDRLVFRMSFVDFFLSLPQEQLKLIGESFANFQKPESFYTLTRNNVSISRLQYVCNALIKRLLEFLELLLTWSFKKIIYSVAGHRKPLKKSLI